MRVGSIARRVFTAAALIVFAGGTPLTAQQPIAGFDAYVARAVAAWGVPGLAIAVVKGDTVAFIKGYGVRTLGTKDAVDIHTLFANASTTKAFTSFEVLQEADSGKLSLDTRVADVYPILQLQQAYPSADITMRDLLTHRTGVPEADFLWYLTSYDFPTIAKKMRLVKPTYGLRAHFQYENVTYAAAGYIAAQVAGADWEALYKKRIFTPLGMNETFTSTDAAVAHGNIATPHYRISDTVRPIDRYRTDNIGPAGSMYSSVSDMAKWMSFLLDSARLGGKRLLSAEQFSELWHPQMLVEADEFYPTARLTKPNFTAYGLGWFLEDYRGEKIAFHTGSIDGFSAIVGLIPERKVGVVIFANLDHAELRHALMYTVFDRYIGGSSHDWSAEMLALYGNLRARQRRAMAARDSVLAIAHAKETKPSLPLAEYAGTYSDELYGTFKIKLVNGALVSDNPLDPGPIDHWSYDTFQFVHDRKWMGKDMITFQIGDAGTVTGLTPGDGIVLQKVTGAQ